MSLTPTVLEGRATVTLRRITVQAPAFQQLHALALEEKIGHEELAARLLEIALLSGDEPGTPVWPLERARRAAHAVALAIQRSPVPPSPDGADADRQAEQAASVQAGYAADDVAYTAQVYPEQPE